MEMSGQFYILSMPSLDVVMTIKIHTITENEKVFAFSALLISVDLYITYQLMIRYSVFVRYWWQNESEYKGQYVSHL
jgi:hypothetical protein